MEVTHFIDFQVSRSTSWCKLFDLENENPPEMQRQGWQAILDNFSRHVEAKS